MALSTPIPSLLKYCGPSAILWAVRAIVIDAVYALSARTLAHVAPEVLKPHPLGAHGYPSASIIAVGVVALIQAATFHGGPDPVFGRADMAVLQGVTYAPAATSVPYLDLVAVRCELATTAAQASIEILPVRVDAMDSENSHAMEHGTAQIYVGWHLAKPNTKQGSA